MDLDSFDLYELPGEIHDWEDYEEPVEDPN